MAKILYPNKAGTPNGAVAINQQWTATDANEVKTVVNGLDDAVAGMVEAGLLVGSGSPLAATGNNGQYYLNVVDWTFWGPKAAGAWPASGKTISRMASSGVTVDVGTTNFQVVADILRLRGDSSDVGVDIIDPASEVRIGQASSAALRVFQTSAPGSAAVYVEAPAHDAGVAANNAIHIIGRSTTGKLVLYPLSGSGSGNTILSGASNPASGTGSDGDFYINTSSYTIFGPKAAGAWPAGVSLVGTPGSAGAPGDDGQGVIPGGTPGQVLEKASLTDYDMQWATPTKFNGTGLAEGDLAVYSASTQEWVRDPRERVDATSGDVGVVKVDSLQGNTYGHLNPHTLTTVTISDNALKNNGCAEIRIQTSAKPTFELDNSASGTIREVGSFSAWDAVNPNKVFFVCVDATTLLIEAYYGGSEA